MEIAIKTEGKTSIIGFIWLQRWSAVLDDLTDAQLGRLSKAVQRYVEGGDYPDFKDDQRLSMALRFITYEIIERDLMLWEKDG